MENNEIKEKLIGKFKPKRKFLNFTSSINGARIRLNRDSAFIKGGLLSGVLEHLSFKITICDEGTINFEEVDTNECDDALIQRLLDDIDSKDVTGYSQKFVVSGMEFKDENGDRCYLEVENKKPIDLLRDLLKDSDESELTTDVVVDNEVPIISKRASRFLDDLFGELTDNVDDNVVDNIDDVVETQIEKPLSHLEEQFKLMNEDKVIELTKRVDDSKNDIQKFKMEISRFEKRIKEVQDKMIVDESRLESMTPGDKPNGFVFNVSQEQKVETGLDINNREIADKIADLMKLKKDVLFDHLTGGFYRIKFGQKDDFTKDLDPSILSLVNKIDINGSFTIFGKNEIEYRGDLNWHQLTSKLIRKGFEQDEEFDKLSGSNSYTGVTERLPDIEESINETINVDPKDTLNVSEKLKTLATYNKPTDLVLLGTSQCENFDFDTMLSLTDDFTSMNVRGNFDIKDFELNFETTGDLSLITFEQYRNMVNEIKLLDYGDEALESFEAILLPGFIGKIEIGIIQPGGNFLEDFDINCDHILNEYDELISEIFINIPDGQEAKLIHDHDISKLTSFLRDGKIDLILSK